VRRSRPGGGVCRKTTSRGKAVCWRAATDDLKRAGEGRRGKRIAGEPRADGRLGRKWGRRVGSTRPLGNTYAGGIANV